MSPKMFAYKGPRYQDMIRSTLYEAEGKDSKRIIKHSAVELKWRAGGIAGSL